MIKIVSKISEKIREIFFNEVDNAYLKVKNKTVSLTETYKTLQREKKQHKTKED